MIILSIFIFLLLAIQWIFGMGCVLSDDYVDDNLLELRCRRHCNGSLSSVFQDYSSDRILDAHARNSLSCLEYDNRRRNSIVLEYDIEAQSALNKQREKQREIYNRHNKLYRKKCSLYRFIFT